MEAVPRMPMLSFELKHSPEYVEFGPTLKTVSQLSVSDDSVSGLNAKRTENALLSLQRETILKCQNLVNK